MTRPEIIRADTIDLQDLNAPSAKDHTRQPTNPTALGDGPPAPHQAIALKNAGFENLELHSRSPRASQDLSGKELQLLQDISDADRPDSLDSDSLGIHGLHRAGEISGQNGDDGEIGDQDGEDGMDDDMMDKISSSPSIDSEDISFEFVYALHTFVATVEGQANATKGDTMVLLDDSNSYWWLVRVVKDSSIGYLPAEHIETPTERLARLNKHRNIDLSQSMLGDNPGKSKNPLIIALRRRNAKAVQWGDPTYYEPSDNDYSSDEEEEDGQFSHLIDSGGLMLQDQDTQASHDETAAVEPLTIRDSQRDLNGNADARAEPQSLRDESEQESPLEKNRSSEEASDYEMSSGKSRKGTVRNTDSFFKDDTNETRKITLTPALFRDDSNTPTLISGEAKEPKTRVSLDALDKTTSPSEKPKDEKRKEKKHGMLSGLFKRKDRKSKSQSEDDDPEWLSKEIARQGPGPKVASDSINHETQLGSVSPGPRSPQRQTSKLQKAPPTKLASPTKRAPSREGQMSPTREMSASQTGQIASMIVQPPSTSLQANNIMESEREYVEQPSASVEEPIQTAALQQLQPIEEAPDDPFHSHSQGGNLAPVRDALRSSPSTSEAKVENTRIARQRMPIDDSDSSPDVEHAPSNPFQHPEKVQSNSEPTKDRLSESPVQVSPVQPVGHLATAGDTSSQEEPSMSMSTSSTPELVEVPQEESVRDDATPTSTIQSSRIPPTWSDASLRTYLEDDTEIRDLLVVVHDKTDIKPAGPDHPVVQNLCKEENQRLGKMSSQLDAMLQVLLARNPDNASR